MIYGQKDITEKGKDLFYRLKPKLEKKYQSGHYVTIEVKSGKYFVAKNPVEAINKASKQYPNRQFYLAQLGRAAGILK